MHREHLFKERTGGLVEFSHPLRLHLCDRRAGALSVCLCRTMQVCAAHGGGGSEHPHRGLQDGGRAVVCGRTPVQRLSRAGTAGQKAPAPRTETV